MSSGEADRSVPSQPPWGLLAAAVIVSLLVGVLLLLSSNAVLAIISGLAYLVGLLLLSPDVVGIAAERAGRMVDAVVVLGSMVLLVLAYVSGG